MKKISLLFLLAVIMAATASAVSINIDIGVQDVFGLGDTITFDYTISSDTAVQITYMDRIECPNAPRAFLEQKTMSLNPAEPLQGIHSDFFVSEATEPQTCTAYVRILSPVQQIEEKNFTIDVSPGFSFDVLTCKDKQCAEKAKVFILGETMHLDYDSEVPEPEITGILTLPDKTIQQLTLPASITAEQIGTYNLEITASKEGYKTITKKIQFGVIEEEVEIEYKETKLKKALIISSIILLVIIAVVFGIMAYHYYRYHRFGE